MNGTRQNARWASLDSSPKIENESLLGNLIANPVDSQLLVPIVVESALLFSGNDDHVAVVGDFSLLDGDDGGVLWNALLGLRNKEGTSVAAQTEYLKPQTRLTTTWSEWTGHIHLRVGGGIPVMGGSRQSRCQCCSQKSHDMIRRCFGSEAVSLQL
jgi:hypothetical protein